MKLSGTERNIDIVVNKVINRIKVEVNERKDVKIVIDKKISNKLNYNLMFLISDEIIEDVPFVCDNLKSFSFPYDDLDFYIKGEMMTCPDTIWIPVWFDPLIPGNFRFRYDIKKSIKWLKEQTIKLHPDTNKNYIKE